MRIRLVSSPKRKTYDHALKQLKKCHRDVDEFLLARKTRALCAQVRARVNVSRYVPSGVYIRGDDEQQALHAVLGVCQHCTSTEHDGVFYVKHVPVHPSGEFSGDWTVTPLLGINAFLTPIARDGYHGPRFILAGELLHV